MTKKITTRAITLTALLLIGSAAVPPGERPEATLPGLMVPATAGPRVLRRINTKEYTAPIYSPSETVRARNYNKVHGVDWAIGNALAAHGIVVKFEQQGIVFVVLDFRDVMHAR